MRIADNLIKGRLIPLSKKKGSDVVTLDEIRPIVVKSHISKIMEKTILNKIMKDRGHLLKTSEFQRGFKEGKSTLNNLAEIVERTCLQRRKRGHRKWNLFLEL